MKNERGNQSYEKESIELDIAIDEQDENKCNSIVSITEKDKKSIIEIDDRIGFWKKIIRDDSFLPIVLDGKEGANDFWHIYFLAKRIRGILQNKNEDKQSEKLDWIVDILVRAAASKIPNDDRFKYLLLMLELAQCTIGEQSLGFSEKANEILSKIRNENKNDFNKYSIYKISFYESLIHYNLGVAKQHMASYQLALREYNKALDNFKTGPSEKVWKQYVFYPALLQKAEVLIKMQFSYNALVVLNENFNNARDSHKRKRELLRLTCYIDLSDWDRFDTCWKEQIDCEDKKSVFISKDKNLISKNKKSIFGGTRIHRPVKDLCFFNAEKPLPSSNEIPYSLISQYNSIVLDRAKEQLKQIDKIPVTLKIIGFMKEYINQCNDNRFDKLTLEETILDFMETIGRFLLKDNIYSVPLALQKNLKKLINILKKEFLNDLVSKKKPLMSHETIDKAREVFEKINDEFLKIIFHDKNLKKLNAYMAEFFEFEKELIEKLLEPDCRPDLKRKKYDNLALVGRKTLLDVICTNKNNTVEIKKLNKTLIIYKDEENAEIQKICLKQVIKAIKEDQIPDDQTPFLLQFRDYDNIIHREYLRFQKHIRGRSLQPLPTSEKGNDEKEKYSVNYVGLRRWNSYTPELSFSVGGGHFVFVSNNEKNNKGKVNIGIAVDPGFDFIKNFFHQGFSLTDIDIILLTHGHPDHIRDFPAVIELLFENKKRRGSQEKKIYAVMSRGCYERLEDHIAKSPFKYLFYDTVIVDIDNKVENSGVINFSRRKRNNSKKGEDCLRNIEGVVLIPPHYDTENGNMNIDIGIKYFQSFHQDHSESDSYGYILEFNGKEKGVNVSIGFTGDSKWFTAYAKKFKDCDVICSHIGSIAEPIKHKRLKDYNKLGKAERLMRTKNHPYLFGEILFWQDWIKIFKDGEKKPLLLISEFGEEMKGMIRCDLARRFNNPRNNKCCWDDKKINCTDDKKNSEEQEHANCTCNKEAENLIVIPVDVGLRINIPPGKNECKGKQSKLNDNLHPQLIHCAVCGDFVSPNEIEYEVYSHEEAIFYICQTCKRSVSIDVRHTIFQKHHEQGRKIERYE